MFGKFKYIILGILSLSVIGSSFLFSPTPSAQAGVPVVEIGPALTALNIIAGQTTAQTVQTFKEWAETFIRTTLKKRLLDVLVDQIIQYIQGGGKPKFVTDWQGFLADAGQAAAGDFAKSLGLGFLCEPFSFQIQLGLLPVPTFSERASCTLNQIVGNIQNFYDDFRNGGWLAFNASWDPQNNYFGSLLMALSEEEKRRGNAAYASELEALAGAGFLSVKDCERDANGVIIQSTCRVTTPGKVLGDLTAKAVGSDIDFILSAEQLSDYVAAIANAAINRLVSEGAKGLLAVTTRSAPSEGFVPAGTVGTCAGLTGAALQACQNFVADSGNSYIVGRTTILNQIDLTIGPRQEAQPIIASSIQATQQFTANLNSLYSSFNALSKTTCTAPLGQFQPILVASVKQSIQNELSQATTTLSNLQKDFAKNQALIDPLQAAKDQIQNLNSGDWVDLTKIYLTITGKLDAVAASNFKSAAEAQQDAISQNINQKLSTFNQQLQQCQATP